MGLAWLANQTLPRLPDWTPRGSLPRSGCHADVWPRAGPRTKVLQNNYDMGPSIANDSFDVQHYELP